jgi:hypothetical protein
MPLSCGKCGGTLLRRVNGGAQAECADCETITPILCCTRLSKTVHRRCHENRHRRTVCLGEPLTGPGNAGASDMRRSRLSHSD